MPFANLADAGLNELAVLAAGLLFTGAISGVVAGLLGVGGGIVIVPVLYHILSSLDVDPGLRMHVAVATSLATIVVTSISSARAHYRRDSVDRDLLRHWAPFVLVGVLAGTATGGFVKGETLSLVFAAVAILVAVNMAFRPNAAPVRHGLPRPGWQRLLAGGIGAVSAMMGIGGGTLTVPILGIFDYPIRRAVGTAAAIGLIIGVPGTAGYLYAGLGVAGLPPGNVGYVNLIGFLLIVPASYATAPLGARLAHAVDTILLKRLFALFLFASALRMIHGALG